MSEPRPPYVTFETRAVEDREASVATGHFVAKDVVFAIVTPAGTRDRLEKVADEWLEGVRVGVQQERIPASWLTAYETALKAYRENREIPENGTHVSNWPGVSPAQVQTILGANIRTVEELAEANDEALSYIGMGARALKSKAQAWLDSAEKQGKAAGELEALRAEVVDLKARNEVLQQQVAELKKAAEPVLEKVK